MNAYPVDVLIVGSGPAGLAAALELARDENRQILVVDRDDAPGGLPHYAAHPGFGWEYTGQPWHTGHAFTAHMLQKIAARPNIRLLTRTTLLSLHPGPSATLLNPEAGEFSCAPRAILLATGTREAARAPRLIGGNRPEHAFLSTGFLQQWLTRGLPKPFPVHGAGRAVIVGTEWVAFSAWLSARKLGLHVTAFVEGQSRIQAPEVVGSGMSRFFGMPIYTSAVISGVESTPRGLAGVEIQQGEHRRFLPCEHIILTGGWQADSAEAEASGLDVQPATRSLIVDQFFRTSLRGVWACGNVLQPVLTSGLCARQGKAAGASVSRQLAGSIDVPAPGVYLLPGENVLSVTPSLLCAESASTHGLRKLHLRANQDMHRPYVQLMDGEEVLWEKALGSLKATRAAMLPLAPLLPLLSGRVEARLRLVEKWNR